MNSFSVATATLIDVAQYVSFAAAAQVKLRERGLAQWVPAAHARYAETLRDNIEMGIIKRVETSTRDVAAFFAIATTPSEWWQETTHAAAYVSGIVVSPHHKNCGVGEFVLSWVDAYAIEQCAARVRLDCHADNRWLCRYYERAGFSELARIEQHPGYVGALFEKRLAILTDAASTSQ